MYIKVAKINEDAYFPERANPSDAGMDIRVPEKVTIEGLKSAWQPPYKYRVDSPLVGVNSVVIPTGLKVEVPHGYMLEIKNKSSIGSKGILVGACVIDSGYKGELKVNLINVSGEEVSFEKGDKIAQMVLTPVISCGIVKAEEEDLYKKIKVNSDRGEGGFGSTGK